MVALGEGASPRQEYILCAAVSGGFFLLGGYFQYCGDDSFYFEFDCEAPRLES